MEIIDKKGETATPLRRTSYLFLGILLILTGGLWLLYNYNVLSDGFFDVIFSWQMLVTLIGVWLLATKNWIAGAITTGVGALFLMADIFDFYISFSKVVLPVLLIALGAVCLFIKTDKK